MLLLKVLFACSSTIRSRIEQIDVTDIGSIVHLRDLPRGSMDLTNISVDDKNLKLHRI